MRSQLANINEQRSQKPTKLGNAPEIDEAPPLPSERPLERRSAKRPHLGCSSMPVMGIVQAGALSVSQAPAACGRSVAGDENSLFVFGYRNKGGGSVIGQKGCVGSEYGRQPAPLAVAL
jgi:hypothetical protein